MKYLIHTVIVCTKLCCLSCRELPFKPLWEHHQLCLHCGSCCPPVQSVWAAGGLQLFSCQAEGWRSWLPSYVEVEGSWNLLASQASLKNPRPSEALDQAGRRSSCTCAVRQSAQKLWDSLQQTNLDACRNTQEKYIEV